MSAARGKPIFLESKVGSKLGEEQLRRYKDFGVGILVAVTKNWPEVPRARLKAIGVRTLRWQDISQALRQSTTRNPRDRFVCEAFAEFLEESGMAYREALAESDLAAIRDLLCKIAAPKYSQLVPGPSFELAQNCVEFLRDVKQIFLELNPTLAKWRSWGPGYVHEAAEAGGPISWHAFGFDIFPEKWSSRHLSSYLYLPVDESPAFWFFKHLRRRPHAEQRKEVRVDRLLSKGRLDAERVARQFSSVVRSWKVR